MDLLLPAASVRLTSRIQDPVQAFMASFRGRRAGAAHGKERKKGGPLAAADAAHGAYVFQARQREAYLAGLERQRARTPAACCSKAHYCSPRSAHAREMCTSSISHADRAGDLVSFPFPHSHAVLDCNLPASADAS